MLGFRNMKTKQNKILKSKTFTPVILFTIWPLAFLINLPHGWLVRLAWSNACGFPHLKRITRSYVLLLHLTEYLSLLPVKFQEA